MNITIKGTVYFRSGHNGAIDLWKNSDLQRYSLKIFILEDFAPETMSLPRKMMEQ